MSAVYSIVGKADAWLPVVKGLLAQGGEWQAKMVYCDAEESSPEDIQGSTEFQCFVEASVRGVAVNPADGRHDVRLNLFASTADVAFAFRVMREALKAGAAVACESGEMMTPETLSDEGAAATQREQWQAGLGAMRDAVASSDNDAAYLPVVGRQLPVTSADLALGTADLEAELGERTARYLTAYPASVFTQQHESGEEIDLSNFPGFPTLIPKAVQAISFQGEGGKLIEPWVPAGAFFMSIGGRLEDAGDCWYVPEIDLRAEAELLEALRATAGSFDPKPDSKVGAGSVPAGMQVDAHVSNSPASSGDGGGEGTFTPEECDMLRRVSVIVLMLVAGADGKVDKKELRAFAGILSGTANLPPDTELPVGMEVLFLAFSLTASALESTIDEVFNHSGGAVAHLAELTRIGQLLDTKLTPEAAAGAKMGLFGLGESIAEASGGFLGFGSKVSKEERASLDLIAATLGISGEQTPS